jgi:DNA-binding transcriptional MerR regulator
MNNKEMTKAIRDATKDFERLAETQIRNADEFNAHFSGSVGLMKSFGDQLGEASKLIQQNTTSQAKSVKHQQKLAKETKKHYDEIKEQEAAILALRTEMEGRVTAARKKEIEEEIEAANYLMAAEMKHAKKLSDFRTSKLAEEDQERETRYKEYMALTNNHKKNMQKMGAFGKNMGGMAQGGDIGGMATGGLEGVGSILKQLSGVGGKLGMVAGALGATVGVLGVFVGLMFQADKKAKDMNKNFMAGASGLDLMGKAFEKGKMTDRLFDMREMAFDVGMQFRMSSDEVATLASSFNQFGLRYDEMANMVGSTGDPVKALEANLQVAITKSKMLGVEANTVAEQIASMNENFAMDLSQIDDAFSAIYMSAQTTGVATQKFFSMITQVTGGMSLLNVDFAQTAAIAGELVESLGEAAGSKFLQDLSNRGRSKSYQERFKSALLSGGKTSRIGKKGVKSRAAALEQSSGFRTLTNSDDFKNTLQSLGVDNFDSSDIIGSFKNMTMKQQRNLIASSGNTSIGGSAEIERQLRALQQLNISSQQGGITGSAVQQGQFNTGENMAQFLAESGAFADLSKGQSLGGMSRAVLEQISGRSGMEVDQMVTMVDKMNSNMGVVQTYSERMDKMMKEEGMTGQAALAKLAQEKNMETGEFQKMLEEQYKLTLGADGKVMSSVTGTEVKDLEGYMINMGDSMKSSVEQAMSMEDAMTSEIVKNTASASAVLENVIGKYLNKISGFVEGIYEWLFDSKDKEADQQKAKDMVTILSDEMDKLYKKREDLEAVQSDLGAKVKSGKATAKEKSIYETNEQARELLDIELDVKSRQRTAYQRSGSYSGARGEVGEIQRRVTDKKMEIMGSNSFQQIEEGLIRARNTMIDDYETYARNAMGREEGDIVTHDRGLLMSEADLKEDTMGYIQPLLDQGFSIDEIKQVMGLQPTPSLKDHSGNYSEDGLVSLALFDLQNAATNGRGANASSITPTLLSSEASGDVIGQKIAEGEVLAELTEKQITIQGEMEKQGKHAQDSLDSMVTSFESLGADTDEMKKFQEKGLPPAIGKEVMKAMVAEKLFDVASAAGMSLDKVMEAYSSQQDPSKKNSYVKDDLDRQLKAGKIKEEEYNKQIGVIKTLGLQDGYFDGQTMTPMGAGALIFTPDGQAYHTRGDDEMLVGTNLSGGGGSGGSGDGGIHIGTVVVKSDDPETFRRKLKAVAKTKSGRNAMNGRSR